MPPGKRPSRPRRGERHGAHAHSSALEVRLRPNLGLLLQGLRHRWFLSHRGCAETDRAGFARPCCRPQVREDAPTVRTMALATTLRAKTWTNLAHRAAARHSGNCRAASQPESRTPDWSRAEAGRPDRTDP